MRCRLAISVADEHPDLPPSVRTDSSLVRPLALVRSPPRVTLTGMEPVEQRSACAVQHLTGECQNRVGSTVCRQPAIRQCPVKVS